MNGVFIFLFIIIIFIIHTILSLMDNKNLGLIIPGICLILAVVVPMLLSDFPTAIIIFILLIIPIVIMYFIYKHCRKKAESRKKCRINKMKINDI